MSKAKYVKVFLAQLSDVKPFIELMSNLPDVYFFMKDKRGMFVLTNDLMLQQCNTNKDEIVGQNDFAFFPHELAQGYVSDDMLVIKNGVEIINKVELVKNRHGKFNWFVTSKMPLISKAGKIVGLAGYTRDLKQSPENFRSFETMANVVEYIQLNFTKNIQIADLADKAHLSTSQFERKFKKIFHSTPGRYIMRLRILAGCRELAESDASISQIALKVGFYDHSAFTRYFTKIVGLSPRQYRLNHRVVNK